LFMAKPDNFDLDITGVVLRIGKYSVSFVDFGRLSLDGGAMFGVVPKTLWSRKAPADEANRITLALRCLLIRDGKRNILVDCGVGHKNDVRFDEIFSIKHFWNYRGNLPGQQLKAEDITDLVLTHLHFDHVGGAVSLDDKQQPYLTFPNATVHVQRKQWEHSINPNIRDRASYLSANLDLLHKAKLNILEDGGELFPGIHMRVINGHTPGMQMVEVQNNDGTPGLIYCADLIPTAAHLPIPWVMGYDLEPLTAVSEKEDLYRYSVKDSTWLFFEHDPEIAAAKISFNGPKVISSVLLRAEDWPE
jgi:glyoxylase-like metal-dependent hydrolase (beta-lactamase superfamily II)